jgi:hypothetical protein
MIVYTDETVFIANTPLGKFLFIVLLLYYTRLDSLYGLLFCLSGIIFYSYLDMVEEGLENLSKMNVLTEHMEDIRSEDFQKKYCENGVISYKGNPVRPELIQHVYPELHIPSGDCNPCLANCEVSIISEKIRIEEELQTPKNSNDFFDGLFGSFLV